VALDVAALRAPRDLPDLLNAAGRELADARGPNTHLPGFRVTLEGKERSLVLSVQDEVYRIAREVIRNAFRYDDDQLRLRIRDDGKGI
jgi:signal transduction histidine kinase